MCLQYWFVISWRNKITAKAIHKFFFVKLTLVLKSEFHLHFASRFFCTKVLILCSFCVLTNWVCNFVANRNQCKNCLSKCWLIWQQLVRLITLGNMMDQDMCIIITPLFNASFIQARTFALNFWLSSSYKKDWIVMRIPFFRTKQKKNRTDFSLIWFFETALNQDLEMNYSDTRL